MSSSVGNIIPNKWKNKKCSKPTTSIYQQLVQNFYQLFLASGKMKLKFKDLGHNWDVNGFDQSNHFKIEQNAIEQPNFENLTIPNRDFARKKSPPSHQVT